MTIQQPKSSVKSVEAWLCVLLVIGGVTVAVYLVHKNHGGLDVLGALAGPSGAAGVFAFCRTSLKKFFVVSSTALTTGTPMDIDALIDSYIEKFIASKIPQSAALQPEADAVVTAAEALIHKALDVYVLSRLLPKLPADVQQAIVTAVPGLTLASAPAKV